MNFKIFKGSTEAKYACSLLEDRQEVEYVDPAVCRFLRKLQNAAQPSLVRRSKRFDSLKLIAKRILPLTFLNTKGSSLYTGLRPLAGTILVLNSLRIVSVGRPYISTSTYVPTLRSDRNWPDITYNWMLLLVGMGLGKNFNEVNFESILSVHKLKNHIKQHAWW